LRYPLEALAELRMTRPSHKRFSDQVVRLWLKLTICIDAFKADRSTFMRAAWWYVCGKRLRAKFLFSPLLGNSRSAYQYWRLYRQPHLKGFSGDHSTVIVAIINASCNTSAEILNATQRSLDSESIPTLLIGSNKLLSDTQINELFSTYDSVWIIPLAAGDLLANGAGDYYRAAASTTLSQIIYADDDLIDRFGQHSKPHFKPAWNAELFRHFDFLSGASIVRVEQSKIGFSAKLDWANCLADYAMAANSDQHASPHHIPRILHHRRHRPQPRITTSTVTEVRAELPLISVVIPTRNRVDLLKTCISGLEQTYYDKMEVLIVDNGSDDPQTLSFLNELPRKRYKIIRHPGPFNFSAMNNRAVELATGHTLCLLNNDIEITDRNWLNIMSTQAQRADVGAVGAQLLYPDGRIQHAGVVIGLGNAAAHAHRLLRPTDEGYFRRHALPQFVSAVTAACLVVRKDRFLAVGGLDASCLPVAFNDVDLCMKLNACGWKTLYEPQAQLIHHESVSRGFDRDPEGAARLAGELATLQKRWMTNTVIDPYHHPTLSRFSEKFVLGL
jgi:GT2 family glycosyltransferase